MAAYLMGIMLVGFESAAAQTTIDLAEAVLQCHQAVAATEVDIAQARVEILTRRVQSLQQLGQSGHSSWLEFMSADTELCEATARHSAALQYQTWLQQQSIEKGVSAVTVYVNLPGSKAILGWANVSEMAEPQRTEIFALLNEQLQMPAPRIAALAAAQVRIDNVQHAISTLRQSESDHSHELQTQNLRLSLASAEYSLIESEGRLREAERQQMKSLLNSAVRSNELPASSPAVTENTGPASNHNGYEQSLQEMLSLEAACTGQILVSGALQSWAETDHAAASKLRSLGLASVQRTDLSRMQLQSLEQSMEFQLDFRAWQKHWTSQHWSKPSADVATAVHSLQISVPQLSNELPRNPELLRTIVALFREQALLKAQQDGLTFRMDKHMRLLEKLRNQSQQNPREIQQAMLMKDLLAAQTQHTSEQLSLADLTCAAMSELKEAQATHPTSLEFIDQDAARLMLFAAERQDAQSQETNTAQVERQLRRRVTDVGTLLEQGYAARQEILNAQQQLFDFLAEQEQRTVNAQQSRLRQQMMRQILKKQMAIH